MLKSIIIGLSLMTLIISCAQKNPPRDEIPKIKDLLAKLEQGIEGKNAAVIDSLIIADSYSKGYSAQTILAKVYPSAGDTLPVSFGKRDFLYTENKAIVNCSLIADSAGPGRPAEITLTRVGDRWLVEKFDLK